MDIEEMRSEYRAAAEKFVEDIMDVRTRLESATRKMEDAHKMREILEGEISVLNDDLIPGTDPTDPDGPPTLLLLGHALQTMETTRAKAILLESEIQHLTGIIDTVNRNTVSKMEEI